MFNEFMKRLQGFWQRNGVSLSIVSHGRAIYIINKRTRSVVFTMNLGMFSRRQTLGTPPVVTDQVQINDRCIVT
jgi:hypothetical protein